MIKARIYTEFAQKEQNCHISIWDSTVKGQDSVILAGWVTGAVAEWADKHLQAASKVGECSYSHDDSIGKPDGFEKPYKLVQATYLY